MAEQAATQIDGVFALEVFQQLTNFCAGFGADDKVEPGGVRTGTWRGNDLNRLTAGQGLRQRIRLAVNACANAGMANIGVDRISEVHRRRAGWQLNNAAFRCKDVDLIGKEIGLHAFNKFKRTARTLLQLQQALQPALSANLCGGATFARLFISPVRSDPHFRHLIHILGANLYFDWHAVWTNH